ncbi:MAG: prepilin-type N-terminal cleavage/methylation domain-containing protein [bacterium]|nr:prepilin-type N-terminal cleavage/methylation domain-containing protein [bacterium]
MQKNKGFTQHLVFRKLGAGFTLIELLVVISIIGMLSSVVAANIKSAKDKADNVVIQTTFRNILTAVTAYYNDTGYYPDGPQLQIGWRAILADPTSGSCGFSHVSADNPTHDSGIDSFLLQYVGSIPKIPVVKDSLNRIQCPIYYCQERASPSGSCTKATVGYVLKNIETACLPGIQNPVMFDYVIFDIHVCRQYYP